MALMNNPGSGLLPSGVSDEEEQVEKVGKSSHIASRPLLQAAQAWFTGAWWFGQQEPLPHWDMPQWQGLPEETATLPMANRTSIKAKKSAAVLKSGGLITGPIIFYFYPIFYPESSLIFWSLPLFFVSFRHKKIQEVIYLSHLSLIRQI